MTYIIDTKSKRHLPMKLAVGLAVSVFFVAGTVISASAEDHRGGDHRGGEHRSGDHRGGGWGGGYYAAPPVVYGAPYGYAPPVVFGPSIGLPGITIGIQ
jgi:hypothetical protein